MLTEKDIEFIEKFQGCDDPERLLLSRGKYEGINVPLCVNCIISRKRIRKKLPSWYANPHLVYPNLLCTEQCSSQATAEYKVSVLKRLLRFDTPAGHTGADLTAGLGADSLYLSHLTEKFYCYEQNRELCRALEYNMKELGRENIEVTEMETTPESVAALPGDLSFIYIDPARREAGDSSRRKYSIKECTPNLLELADALLQKSGILLAKLSPMADIKESLKLLPQTAEVHVVALNNECKELLFVMQKDAGEENRGENALIKGINLASTAESAPAKSFRFRLSEEESAVATYASDLGKYLYEPYRHISKCGAFKLLSKRYGIAKLSGNTHLYTSEKAVDEFPGKKYAVKEVCHYSKKCMKEIAKRFPTINLTSKNFPLESDRMKELYKIKDGGNLHLFATTLDDSKKILIIAEPISSQAKQPEA